MPPSRMLQCRMNLTNARAYFGSRCAAVNVVTLGALLLAGCIAGSMLERSRSAHADAQPAVSTPPVAAPEPAFKDVPVHHWAASAVNQLAAKGIVQGTPAAPGKKPVVVYDGNQFVTRYEAAVLLDRFAKAMEQSRRPLHRQTQASVPPLPATWAHDAQADLAQANFLPVSSPLLQGTGNMPVTSSEFSAALAQVVTRISDRSLPPTVNADNFDAEDLGKQP